jgi:single-strand DNA-binding protein
MRSVNSMTLLGNVGADPELTNTTNGGEYVRFSVALNESWKDARGTEHKRTTWVPCVAWNGERRALATLIAKYVKKGDPVYVQGQLETWPQKLPGKEGREISIDRFQVRVNEIVFLGSRGGTDAR